MPATGDYEQKFTTLNSFLISQGWLFPPRILGRELDVLWDRCEQFRTAPPQDQATRKVAETEIANILVFVAFDPHFRAYYGWLAMQQPHMMEFSHLVEAGAHHYFRRDFLSCVHCLLPAIEGVLRSHFAAHNPNHQGKLTQDTLRSFLRSPRQVRSYPERHVMYREALADFLDQWLWRNTKNADWDLSYLNRHYILHGLGSTHYYRSEDCHRLFLFLDLYMEMLVFETGVGEHVFIPPFEPGIERRCAYYERVLLWHELTRFASRGLQLLREHPRYHDENIREPFLEQVARWADVMGLTHPRSIKDDARRSPIKSRWFRSKKPS
jgi:hypothetical protein